jgi:hypothetical protein
VSFVVNGFALPMACDLSRFAVMTAIPRDVPACHGSAVKLLLFRSPDYPITRDHPIY